MVIIITQKRIFNEKNLNLFRDKLPTIDWSNIFKKGNTIDENYLSFHLILTETLNETIPIKKVKVKNCFKKPWLTPGIKKACKNKRSLKILTTHFNDILINDYYKKYEKTLKKSVNISKRIHYIKKMHNSKNKTRTMWQIIKERTNKINQKTKQNITLKNNNCSIIEPNNVANTFNEYFLTVGSISDLNIKPRGRPVNSQANNTIFVNPISPKEVQLIINKLKNKTSCGFDEFPPVLIKHCTDLLVMPLTYLINQSFTEASFPTVLKETIIKPIPKSKATQDVHQFRPIALLSTFSKIFESAMCKQLTSFCEKHNIFDVNQHGFRRKKSTISALFEFTTEIMNIINNKKYAIGLMLDLSKAYDRVVHTILLDKLYGIGIRGQALNWLSSYLNNRQQCVEIEHYNNETQTLHSIKSKLLQLDHSIPQGSVLGCFLFLVYINDLPKIINNKSVLYADDISIVLSCNKTDDASMLVENILAPIDDWLKDHNLELNLSKTKLLQFKPRQKSALQTNIMFNNIPLETVDYNSLLGVNFDFHITWKQHIDKINI